MAYVKNTWVDREGTTRYHETVDEDGALIFTPDYEKVTEIGTPVNADNMNHIEEGIEDHENRITVLEESGDASNFLNKSQITNCLLEVPQNIKLELNNGTLTLKAGSKVIVPNGVDVFDEVAVVSDYSISGIANNSQVMLYYRADLGGLDYMALSHNYSGNTAPTFTGNYAKWYDTANNIMKATSDGGATWKANYSLPLCVFSTDNNGSIISIDQVFNGLGCIDKHFWADKGVKILAPNGRNSDGSINNIECVTNRVIVGTTSNTNHYNTLYIMTNTSGVAIRIGSYYTDFIHKIKSRAELPLATAQNYQYYFIEDEAIWVTNGSTGVWQQDYIVEVGNLYHGADSSISNFETNNVFRAVDYNDAVLKDDLSEVVVITETYSNGLSGYNVYSNGYCEQWGRQTEGVVTLLKPYKDVNYNIVGNAYWTGTLDVDGELGISKVTSTSFKLTIDPDGSQSANSAYWHTAGYIS